jgi:hypothetical protein
MPHSKIWFFKGCGIKSIFLEAAASPQRIEKQSFLYRENRLTSPTINPCSKTIASLGEPFGAIIRFSPFQTPQKMVQ